MKKKWLEMQKKLKHNCEKKVSLLISRFYHQKENKNEVKSVF
jgi:hypothetical protein